MNVGCVGSEGLLLVCVPACARLCWVVVHSRLSAPQGHRTNRDSRGLSPSPSGNPPPTHPTSPLKSCPVRAAVHGSVADLLGCSSGGENLAWDQISSIELCLSPTPPPHTPTPASNFTHTSLMMRKEMLSTPKKLYFPTVAGGG